MFLQSNIKANYYRNCYVKKHITSIIIYFLRLNGMPNNITKTATNANRGLPVAFATPTFFEIFAIFFGVSFSGVSSSGVSFTSV